MGGEGEERREEGEQRKGEKEKGGESARGD